MKAFGTAARSRTCLPAIISFCSTGRSRRAASTGMADAARILYGACTAEGGTWSNACLEEQFDSTFALAERIGRAAYVSFCKRRNDFSERPGSLLLGRRH
eukprot:CAMPEP_0179426948 /NCGR_PEP_ID=MMETSP0799-20121207/13070_1 /TAXON_ID=46947 /ORGANISM="Geminigera cryophila, Strain CCMP2564" /LENGTH=99 /DNA_ID=CAMNT_0021201853 /DNA_START=162 /DNA_END=461 /DNA_ORIENTATION=-